MNRLICLLVLLSLTTFFCPEVAAASEGDKVKKGLELMRAGDFDGALAKFRDAQIEHPASYELHFNIGMALYKLQRWEDARGSFESATFSRNQDIEKTAVFETYLRIALHETLDVTADLQYVTDTHKTTEDRAAFIYGLRLAAFF